MSILHEFIKNQTDKNATLLVLLVRDVTVLSPYHTLEALARITGITVFYDRDGPSLISIVHWMHNANGKVRKVVSIKFKSSRYVS